MRKTHRPVNAKAGSPPVPKTANTYELYRTLPNPLYEQLGGKAKTAQILPEKQGWSRRKKIIVSIAVFLAVVLVGAGGWIGWKLLRNFGWHNVVSIFDNTRLKGEDQGRVNILLVGYSADDPGHAGAQLTDSIMLLSIDTKLHKAFTLSIPRDLYVHIPNANYAKINEAYEDGNAQKFTAAGYPSGGMGMLEEIVSQKLNLPIDYYALIDYTAFRDAVNAVGGITLTISSDEPRGLYDPYTNLRLPNGKVTLNGQTALNLARARGDGPGSYGFPRADFDRTQHQREMLIALAAKATSASVLSNPVKIGDLFDAFGKNVQTDFQLNEVRRLGTLMKQVPSSAFASASLNDATFSGKKDVDLLQSYTTYSGQSALIPAAGLSDYTQIDAYISYLQSTN